MEEDLLHHIHQRPLPQPVISFPWIVMQDTHTHTQKRNVQLEMLVHGDPDRPGPRDTNSYQWLLTALFISPSLHSLHPSILSWWWKEEGWERGEWPSHLLHTPNLGHGTDANMGQEEPLLSIKRQNGWKNKGIVERGWRERREWGRLRELTAGEVYHPQSVWWWWK